MTKHVLKTIRLTTSALAITLAMCAAQSAFAKEKTYNFNIPAESTSKALMDFSRQANVQILFPYEVVSNRTSPAISGEYDRATVLKLLLNGSGLEIASQTEQVITLKVIGQADKTGSLSDPNATTEVIVTGTHIRGANPTSPVHTLTRKDIDRSGYSQIGDLMKSLPEVFAGGQNPGVFAATAGNIANQNYSDASTISLRGLGTDATLVLVDGHRLPSDSAFQGSDISGVPLQAVQRIEVVPDGASALYGADAVAGVVNMVLKKSYSGIDVSAEAGTSSQGGASEKTISILGGHAAANWYGLANIEYFKQDPLLASDRDFTSGVTAASALMDAIERNTLFLSAGANLGEHVDVSFTGLLNDRQSHGVTEYYYGRYTVDGHTPGYSAALMFDIHLPRDWQMHLTGVTSGSHNNVGTEFYGIVYGSYLKNSSQYVEVTADGRAFDTPAGPVKVAGGVGHREERHQESTPGAADYIGATRNVDYVFGEALIPLVQPSTTRTGLHELELNLSARSEHYSDFGQANSPEFGFRYVPFEDLTLRGSWGKSFKAPSFLQMYQSYTVYLFDAESAGYNGLPGSFEILTYGGNRDLLPERSTSWTLGGDFHPKKLDGLTISATYFDIDFKDRVVQPINPLSSALTGNPQFEPFVVWDPSAELQADTISRADTYYNYASTPYDPTKVVGLAYNNYQNATEQKVRGIDLSVHQSLDFGSAQLDVFGNASWLHIDQSLAASLPDVELSGTIFNAPKLKARGGATWQRGGFSATGIVNYISEETDNGVAPATVIASWTTVDLNLAYKLGAKSGFGQGARIALSASNLFDRNPPYAISPSLGYPGLHYDSTNHSILGRYVRLTIAKAW